MYGTGGIKLMISAAAARWRQRRFRHCAVYLTALLAGCAPLEAPDTARVVSVTWQEVPGWSAERHAEALPVFRRSCEKIAAEPLWENICAAAEDLPETTDDAEARLFFERHFMPHKLVNADGGDTGLITGYYEPLLYGARAPSPRYRYPIYALPPDLLHIELGTLYPALNRRRVRGRLAADNTVQPFYSRAEIDSARLPLAGNELLWVDDQVGLFFLHVQGSGLVQLPEGDIVGVGYADQNGHDYRSIGKVLVEWGELALPEVSLFSIREWLDTHPERVEELLNANPSYVFFQETAASPLGPKGSLQVALTPQRSLAVDASVVFLGAPVWLDTVEPVSGAPLRRLMMAQDTGGAIKGQIRADVFWGRGGEAKKKAGLMKSRGRLYVFRPLTLP